MAVLHLLSNPDAATSCVAATAAGDRLLLIGDGVFALTAVASSPARLGLLGDDADARGIPPADTAEVLTYAEFVDWVVTCDNSVTWT